MKGGLHRIGREGGKSDTNIYQGPDIKMRNSLPHFAQNTTFLYPFRRQNHSNAGAGLQAFKGLRKYVSAPETTKLAVKHTVDKRLQRCIEAVPLLTKKPCQPGMTWLKTSPLYLFMAL